MTKEDFKDAKKKSIDDKFASKNIDVKLPEAFSGNNDPKKLSVPNTQSSPPPPISWIGKSIPLFSRIFEEKKQPADRLSKLSKMYPENRFIINERQVIEAMSKLRKTYNIGAENTIQPPLSERIESLEKEPKSQPLDIMSKENFESDKQKLIDEKFKNNNINLKSRETFSGNNDSQKFSLPKAPPPISETEKKFSIPSIPQAPPPPPISWIGKRISLLSNIFGKTKQPANKPDKLYKISIENRPPISQRELMEIKSKLKNNGNLLVKENNESANKIEDTNIENNTEKIETKQPTNKTTKLSTVQPKLKSPISQRELMEIKSKLKNNGNLLVKENNESANKIEDTNIENNTEKIETKQPTNKTTKLSTVQPKLKPPISQRELMEVKSKLKKTGNLLVEENSALFSKVGHKNIENNTETIEKPLNTGYRPVNRDIGSR